MLEKKKKNFLIFLKNKNKENKLKLYIIHNYYLDVNKLNFFKTIINSKNKNKKTSQLNMKLQGVKKISNLNRWEIYQLYTNNKLSNFRQWTK